MTVSHSFSASSAAAKTAGRHALIVGPLFTVKSDLHVDAIASSMGIWEELSNAGFHITRILSVADEARREQIQSLSTGRLSLKPFVAASKTMRTLGRDLGLNEILEAFAPEIVHCIGEPWQPSISLAVRTARRVGAARGIHFAENGPGLQGPGRLLRLRCSRAVLGRCSYAVGWSSPAVFVARERWRFAGRIEAFPAAGVPKNFFNPRRTDRRRDPKILFVGRLVPEKGVLDYLSVATVLASRGIRFLIVGDGPLRSQVLQAEKRGLIEYLGALPRASLADLMGQAAVMLVPSRPGATRGLLGPVRFAEQFGLVIAESLAAGTPVVAYNVGSIAETLGPGGLLTDVGNASGLIQATLSLLEDHDLWSEKAALGREWVTRFRDDHIAARLAGPWGAPS